MEKTHETKLRLKIGVLMLCGIVAAQAIASTTLPGDAAASVPIRFASLDSPR